MNTNIENRIIWLNGKLTNVNDAKVNVLSPTAQFGLNVFEGIPCYWNEIDDQLYAFRLDDHYNRLLKSIKLLQINCSLTKKDLFSAFIDCIKANDYKENISVRQTVYVDGFGTWSSADQFGMFISPIPRRKTSSEYNKKMLNCCISSWQRINENSLSPRIKCGANYINSRFGQREAIRNGYDTCIFLNSSGKVSEGPGSCLFIVKNKVLITPCLTDDILESITRDTIMVLCKELGFEVIERSINRTELYSCDEAFLCGSSMGITPISSIDKSVIGNGECGEVTSVLLDAYMRAVTGRDKKHSNWLTPIY